MFFKIKNGKFYCYGLGYIRYNRDYKIIFLRRKLNNYVSKYKIVENKILVSTITNDNSLDFLEIIVDTEISLLFLFTGLLIADIIKNEFSKY